MAVVGNHPYYHPWRSIARDTDQRYRHQPGSGVALSGVLTVLIGFSGLGHRPARLFTPSVMVLFYVDAGRAADHYLFKGMLGLPFGIADPNFKIQLPPFALSVAVMCPVLGMIIFLPQRFARYGLLVGTITGWFVVVLLLSFFALALR